MRVGLLICDYVRSIFRSAHGDYPRMFQSLFADLDFVYYDAIAGELPRHVDDCDVYMATGSRYSVYEDIFWIHALKDFVKKLYEEKKYFIGFCFGHQLIGEALGGSVRKSPDGWCVGVHTTDVLEDCQWMIPRRDQINLLMMCQDQIFELPEGSKILASTSCCPVSIIQVGETMLGIQSHPEFTKDYDRALMELQREKMGKDTVRKGIQSLKDPVHGDIIAQWVVRFIHHRDS